MSQISSLSTSSNPSIPTSFDADTGVAVPVANILVVTGTGGITTSGAGNVLTITGSEDANEFVTDGGTAIPVGGILNVLGGTGVSTAGVGDTITITASGSVPLEFLTQSGNATPAANDISIVGISGITTSGAGAVVTINNLRDLSNYVVSPIAGNSEYTTITAAITQAVADGATDSNRATIYVKPGTYAANVALAPGIDIVGCGGRNAVLDDLTTTDGMGTNLFPVITGAVTDSASGTATISYMRIAPTAAADCLTATAGTTHLYNCLLHSTQTAVGCIVANAGDVYCFKCIFLITFPSSDVLNMSHASSHVIFHECCSGAGSNGTIRCTAGALEIYGGVFAGGVLNNGANVQVRDGARLRQQGTGDGSIDMDSGSLQLHGAVLAGTTGGLTGGGGTVTITGCFNEDEKPAISNDFTGTVVAQSFGMGCVQWRGGWSIYPTLVSSFPYTMLETDSYLSVGGTGARTVNLLATGRLTGQTVIIKDAALNSSSSGNITISGNGVNILGTSSAATYVLSTNGASVSLLYNGTAWEVF